MLSVCSRREYPARGTLLPTIVLADDCILRTIKCQYLLEVTSGVCAYGRMCLSTHVPIDAGMLEPQQRAVYPALCAHRIADSSSVAPGQKRCEKKGP